MMLHPSCIHRLSRWELWGASAQKRTKMNNIILSLRNFSLRWLIAIYFIATIVEGISSVTGDRSLGTTTIITAIGSIMLYMTFAVQAIKQDDKAVTISYIVIVANLISVVGLFNYSKESPDFASSMVNDFLFGENSIESWVQSTVISVAPYTFGMSALMLAAFVYGRNYVIKKFNAVWTVTIIAYAIFALEFLILFIGGIEGYAAYEKLNYVATGLSLIMMVMLWIAAKREKAQTIQQPPHDTPQPAPKPGMQSKSEQLIDLKKLLDAGVLTQEEFDAEKSKILNS